MENSKKWYESKTMWFSIAVALIGVLEAVSASLTESGTEGVGMMIIGVLSGLLRYVTAQPIE